MAIMLEVLGVDPESEHVYAGLLSAPPMRLDDLAGATGLPPARVRVALRRLQSSGLVERRPGRTVTYVAINPEVALDGLLLTRQEQLRNAKLRTAEFAEQFRRAAAIRDYVAWTLEATRSLGIKVINAGAAAAFKARDPANPTQPAINALTGLPAVLDQSWSAASVTDRPQPSAEEVVMLIQAR